jgi:hypothetical protein
LQLCGAPLGGVELKGVAPPAPALHMCGALSWGATQRGVAPASPARQIDREVVIFCNCVAPRRGEWSLKVWRPRLRRGTVFLPWHSFSAAVTGSVSVEFRQVSVNARHSFVSFSAAVTGSVSVEFRQVSVNARHSFVRFPSTRDTVSSVFPALQTTVPEIHQIHQIH